MVLPIVQKWGYDIGAGGWGNNESQYYTNRPENVIIQDGLLKIKTLKESSSGSKYTSARILTKDKFLFKYGRAAIRTKLALGAGTWSALWMLLGSKIDTTASPACGEVDIMAHVGNSQNSVHGSLRSPGRWGHTPDTSTVMFPNASTESRVYAIDWSVTSIKFHSDSLLFRTFTNSASLPFNQNFP